MAMLAIPLLGAAIGSTVGYAAVGWAVGTMLYSMMARPRKGTPSIGETGPQTVEEGAAINIVYGTALVTGNVIAAGPVRKVSTPIRQGKGGKKTVGTEVQYFCTYAVALCEGPLNLLNGILIAKRDGRIVFDARPGSGMNADNAAFLNRCTIYLGTEDQLPDPALEGIFGAGEVPAMRGTAYIVFRDEDLSARSGSLPQWSFVIGNGYVPPPFIDQRQSRLVSVSTVMRRPDGQQNLPNEDFANTSLPTWDSYFSEFGSSAVLAYKVYLIGEAPSDTGVQPTKVLPFEPSREYRALISSGFWSNGVCSFQFEFLNSAGATVCVVRSQGYIGEPEDPNPGPTSFTHRVRYGTSLGSTTAAGPVAGGIQTSGIFSCSPGQFAFTTNSGSSDTSSFTIACDAMSIAFVRISNVRAVSTYNMNPSSLLPWAAVIMYRLPTGDDPEPPPEIPPGEARLSDILVDIHARCGAVVPDVSELEDIYIKGLPLGSADYSGANVIDVLRSAYFFDRAEVGGQIVYSRRGKPVVASIVEADLIDVGESSEREATDEYPRKVLLTATSISANYETSTTASQRYSPDVKVTGESSTSVPMVLDEQEQTRMVAIMHKLLWMEAEGEVKFSLPFRWINLMPADCVTLALRGQTRRLRIEEIKAEDYALEVTAKPDRASAYSAVPNYVLLTPPAPPVSILPGDTAFAVLDVSALRDEDDSLVYYAAGAGDRPAWDGAVLQRSTDAGSSFRDAGSLGPAVVGLLLSSVANADKHFTDTTNVVRVQLIREGQEVEPLSDESFLADAGAFAIGRDDGTWEIMQYRDVVDEGGNIFALSMLHRGLLNSETSDHFNGAKFVLLDYVVPIAGQSIWIGSELVHRAVSVGQSPEDAEQQSMVYAGRSQREWPVAFLNAELVGTDISGAWAPCHRFGSDVNPVASANFQGYQVLLEDGDNSETILTNDPSFTFDASGWSTPITVTVAAMNRITGVGDQTSVEVS